MQALCLLHSLCEFIGLLSLLCLEVLGSLMSSIPLVFYSLSISSSTECSELLRWGICWRHIPFRAECSEFSASLQMVWLWVSVFAHIYCGKKLLWWWLNKAWIYNCCRTFIAVSLANSSIRPTPPPRSLAYLVSDCCSPKQHWTWAPFSRVGLNSNQILVGCAHKLCATIAPADLVDRSFLWTEGFVAGLVFTFL